MDTLFRIQRELRKDTGKDNADVLAVIVYSDSTTISQNGRVYAWPIYMTLGNIPLHKRKQPGGFQLIGLLPDTSCEVLSQPYFSISQNVSMQYVLSIR